MSTLVAVDTPVTGPLAARTVGTAEEEKNKRKHITRINVANVAIKTCLFIVLCPTYNTQHNVNLIAVLFGVGSLKCSQTDSKLGEVIGLLDISCYLED